MVTNFQTFSGAGINEEAVEKSVDCSTASKIKEVQYGFNRNKP